MPCPDPGNDCDFGRAVLVLRDSFCLLHQHCSVTLMLELVWVAGVNRNHRSVNVKLSDQRAIWAEFWPEGVGAAFPQAQQTHKNVLLWVLIRNEGFPALVGHIISSNQLNVLRLDLEVHLLNSDFPCPHISAGNVHFPHFSERQLSQIALLHSRSDQRHWNVSLNAVHSHPRRNQSQQFGHDVYQVIGMIVFVLSVLPKFIQACTSDDQCWIDLDSVWSKCRILEELLEALQIPLNAHVRQIWHHMRNDLICAIFCQGEGLLHGLDRMSSVGVSCDIFVDALHSDLKPSAAVRQEVRKVSFSAKVRPSFNGDTNAFGLALLRKLNSLIVIRRHMPAQCIMQIFDEIISILLIQRHESSAHDDELYLIDIMAYLLQLLHSISGLDVRVVAGSDGSHRSRLVSCV